MKILFQYITSAFVNKEIELAEAGSMARSLLNLAGNKQIEVYHAGKNIEFWDNIDDVDFDNLTVNWGGYGSRISVDNLYNYFKFVYPGDEIVDGRIKTKVKIKSKPFTLVKAFFEEDVDKDIINQFLNLGGNIGFTDDVETELWVTKDKWSKEKKIEKALPFEDERDGDFIFIAEEDLKLLFPVEKEKKERTRKTDVKEDVLAQWYSTTEIENSLVSNKTQFAALKRLLESEDKELIDNGLSLLSTFDDDYLIDTLLLPVDIQVMNDQSLFVPNSNYKGTKSGIPYFNYVITAILYFAGPNAKRAEQIKSSFSKSLQIDIVDLLYLQCFKNLESLFLKDSLKMIYDLDNLHESLPLKKLHLVDCSQIENIDRLVIFPITDFEFGISKNIKSFKALSGKLDLTKKLKLDFTKFQKLDSLEGLQFYQEVENIEFGWSFKIYDYSILLLLKKLRKLSGVKFHLTSNEDLSSLFLLKIPYLNLEISNWNNQISIQSEFLQELNIYCGEIFDLEWLVGFPNLTKLIIKSKNLVNIKGLRHVKKLLELEIYSSQLKSLSGIESLEFLSDLKLYAESLIHIDELSSLNALENFYFDDLNQLESFEGYFKNKNLTKNKSYLNLFKAPNLKRLGDLSLLKDLTEISFWSFNEVLINDLNTSTSLKTINIRGTEIFINSPLVCGFEVHLSYFKKIDLSNSCIEHIIIESENIKNLAGIENMSHLRSLKIIDCENLESLDGLKQLSNIKSIYLKKLPKLNDIKALKELGSLEFISFGNLSEIKNTSCIAYLNNLTEIEILNDLGAEVPIRYKKLDKDKILSYRIKLAEYYELDLLGSLKGQKSRLTKEDKKQIGTIKNLLKARDKAKIDSAIEMLLSLNSETIINELLLGIGYRYNQFKLNTLFLGTGPAQVYLNYALLGVLHCANAFEKWRIFNASIEELEMNVFEVDYMNQFVNLKRIEFAGLTNFSGSIDLPNLEKLHLTFIGDFNMPDSLNLFTFDSIRNCKKIKEIYISKATIKGGLTVLENMFDLESFTLYYCIANELDSLVPFKNATKLVEINFHTSWRKEVVPLKSLNGLENCINLSSLIIGRSILEDTNALLELKQLKEIIIEVSKIKMMTLPKSLKHLKQLLLSNAPIEKITETQVPESIDRIQLNYLNVDNIDFLKGIKEIKWLEIWGCSLLKDLKGLSTLQSLERYEIRKCYNLTDVNDFLKLNISEWNLCFQKIPSNIIPNKLKHLVLQDIETLEGIEQFPETEILNLEGSNVKDLKGIGKLKNLKYLNLGACKNLTTLDGIEELTSLKFLGINYTTNLSDIKSLEKIMINVVCIRNSNFKKIDFPDHLQNSIDYNKVVSSYDFFKN
jgi:hypothetical protein